MNVSNFYHAVLATLTQIVICALCVLIFGIDKTLGASIGGAFSVGFYFGREVSQSEYKNGRDPWWTGFKFSLWSSDAKLDLVFPLVSCTFVSAVVYVLSVL